MILGIEDPVMEGNAPADADGRTLAPRLELRREVDNPVVVTRDPRGTARGTAMDSTAGDIPERVVPNKSGDIVTTSGDRLDSRRSHRHLVHTRQPIRFPGASS